MPDGSRAGSLRIDGELQRFRFLPSGLNGGDELGTIGDIGGLQSLERGPHRQGRFPVRVADHQPRVVLRNQGGTVLRDLGANGNQGIEQRVVGAGQPGDAAG